MPWRIEFAPAAFDELSRLDRPVQKRIVSVLKERLAPLDDPRSLGAPLRGKEFGEFWRYRIGDYRLICRIEDAVVRILDLRVGHRREVYR